MFDYSHYHTLKIEVRNSVLTLSLNRPERLNAVNGEMHTELSRVFADIGADQSVKAVILTGEGRGFCAGGDITWVRDIGDEELVPMFREARKIIIDILELEIPLIAAVNGPAIGLGATLALFCDVVFMAAEARIGDPHVGVGVAAGDGGAVIWPWLVGAARAKEFLMTGDIIDAATAERIGLVNHVVPADQLLAMANKLAERLSAGPILAIRATKASINKILRDTANIVLDTALAREQLTFHTRDRKEAAIAFHEKRPPVFTGS